MEAYPGGAEILGAPRGWTRIGGREVRGEGNLPTVDGTSIARHPEFNAWWLNVLQTHVLTPNEPRPKAYAAVLSDRNEESASIFRPPAVESRRAQAYLPDSEAASLFADDPEMTALIGDLAREGFWRQMANGERRRYYGARSRWPGNSIADRRFPEMRPG